MSCSERKLGLKSVNQPQNAGLICLTAAAFRGHWHAENATVTTTFCIVQVNCLAPFWQLHVLCVHCSSLNEALLYILPCCMFNIAAQGHAEYLLRTQSTHSHGYVRASQAGEHLETRFRVLESDIMAWEMRDGFLWWLHGYCGNV